MADSTEFDWDKKPRRVTPEGFLAWLLFVIVAVVVHGLVHGW